jgi:glycosyltransferase involved in cell wall biosynthesis
VSSSVFNPYAGTGVTLSNLFRDWPADSLAMIHADETFEPDHDLCGSYYKISSGERRMLSLVAAARRLSRLRRIMRRGRAVETHPAVEKSAGRSLSHSRGLQVLSRTLGDLEPLAGMRISKELIDWVKDFRPDVVYAPVSTITYMRFVRELVSLTGATLAIHIMDDWPSFNYDSGILGPFFRRVMKRELEQTLSLAQLRVGIGPAMCDEYGTRYGRPFVPFSNPEDIDHWQLKPRKKYEEGRPFEVLYVGTINNKNRESLGLLADSVSKLSDAGNDIRMKILTFKPRVDIYRPVLSRPPSVTVGEAPGDLTVFRSLLMGADLLVMPLDFTTVAVARMRISFFTKIPAYMLSGVPILMLGPLGIGVVAQAQSEGWAYVVSESRADLLQSAFLKLMHDEGLRSSLSDRGRTIAEERHSAKVVRESFRSALCAIA